MGLLKDIWHAGGTGGLNWHVHAHYSRERWQPTVRLIENFLAQVQPSSRHLLLIGGSAGWMMPPSWLARFERIDAYDIDPLAPWLFNRNHGPALKRSGTRITHHRLDALQALPHLLAEHPHACLWFDNVLGQHRYRIRNEVRAEQELDHLKRVLQDRAWGSLHDVFSGPTDGRPMDALPQPWIHHRLAQDDSDQGFSQKLLSSVGAKEVWQDHLTQQVFTPNTLTTWMPWAFKPNYWHWLQAGWVSP